METRPSSEALNVESSPFAAEDYVQMACQLRRSAELLIRYPDGSKGGIVVHKGDLWHAWDKMGDGAEAFLRMVGVAHVTRIRSLDPSNPFRRTITESCQKLLLRAVIAQDTKNALPPPLPLNDEAEAITARSYTDRPVEINVVPVGKPRNIATFLRQPAVIQRGAAILFGVILLSSVGRIVASPAGGESDAPATNSQPEPVFAATMLSPVARQPVEASVRSGGAVSPARSARAEAVFKVSALETIAWTPPTALTRIENVVVTGALDGALVTQHVMSASPQFAACYDWAASRSPNQSGMGDIAVGVAIDEDGSVISASSRGGKLRGLNTCVAQLAERLGTLLKSTTGPGRMTWTVSYAPRTQLSPSPNGEIH